jgi:hypothetical protein
MVTLTGETVAGSGVPVGRVGWLHPDTTAATTAAEVAMNVRRIMPILPLIHCRATDMRKVVLGAIERIRTGERAAKCV